MNVVIVKQNDTLTRLRLFLPDPVVGVKVGFPGHTYACMVVVAV